MKRIRLVLADDHPIVLDGLEQLFSTEPDLEVVARATSAQGALRALEEFRPDVLVLDLAMPGLDGLWVMEQAFEKKMPSRIVLLTAHIDEPKLLEAVRLNVAGVVLKEMAPRPPRKPRTPRPARRCSTAAPTVCSASLLCGPAAIGTSRTTSCSSCGSKPAAARDGFRRRSWSRTCAASPATWCGSTGAKPAGARRWCRWPSLRWPPN